MQTLASRSRPPHRPRPPQASAAPLAPATATAELVLEPMIEDELASTDGMSIEDELASTDGMSSAHAGTPTPPPAAPAPDAPAPAERSSMAAPKNKRKGSPEQGATKGGRDQKLPRKSGGAESSRWDSSSESEDDEHDQMMRIRRWAWQTSLAPGKIDMPTRRGMIEMREAVAAILQYRDYVLQPGDADLFCRFAAAQTTAHEDHSVVALIRAKHTEPGMWEA